MFASVLSVAHNLGYPTLVLLVMLESSGVPLPGETALITAAVLASQHRLQIELVIALAAAAAIAGDNAGYLIGRKGGRWLLLRPGLFARHRARVLEVGEPFFARHGSKAVFLGRWILGLRTWASWLAGDAVAGLLTLERRRRHQLGDHDRLDRLLRRPQRDSYHRPVRSRGTRKHTRRARHVAGPSATPPATPSARPSWRGGEVERAPNTPDHSSRPGLIAPIRC
jgi:membrane protein YqaA with SNARE-associated domain